MLASKLPLLLKLSRTVNQTKEIHAHILTNGLYFLHPILLNQLLQSASTVCSSQSSSHYVLQIFNQLPRQDEFSWSCTIRYFSQHNRFKEAVALYIRMHHMGPHPSSFSLSSALKACARFMERISGEAIHTQAVKFGYHSDVYVQTALVDLYSKLGDVGTAQKVFDEMPEKNVVSWNSILAGYLKSGGLGKARDVFDEMPVKDVISWNSMISGYAKAGNVGKASCLFDQMPERNPSSWNAMISAYVDCGDVKAARRLFDEMPRRSNVSWITVISGYSKCGDVDSARELFNQMKERDTLSWNAMIACYTQNNQAKEALQLFDNMRNANVHPDKMTLVSAISACSKLGDLRFGLSIETYLSEMGFDMDDHLVTALIDLYAKCGCIEKAYELFHGLRRKDVVAYSAMISGCGINGKPLDSVRLFEEMLASRIPPNAATFTAILTAYNHAGLVEEGYQCFNAMMNDHGLVPSADHYGVMVDLLGRAGRLEEACELIMSMPMQPQVGVWGALLLACRLHCNVEIGEIAAQHCIELEPDPSGYYSLLANIYASVERWDDVKKLRKVMEEKGLTKIPGCSWMESS